MQNKFEPTESMLELKRMLLNMPANKRREVLDKGMAIHHQRQKVAELQAKMAELKAEREELLKEQDATSS